MTTSPESTRPATRRAIRERARAQRMRAELERHTADVATADVATADVATADVATADVATAVGVAAAGTADATPEREEREEDTTSGVSGLTAADVSALAAGDVSALAAGDAGGLAWADETRGPTALTWLDPVAVATAPAPAADAPEDLLAGARVAPTRLRARVLVPVLFIAALIGSYVGATLLWPLDAVAPTAQSVPLKVEPAPAATVAWPEHGSAAVAVQGLTPLESTSQPSEIASLTKVASVLMVLDELPLAPGEQGPSFAFTAQDSRDFWRYRRDDQSSLDVPAGGSLTEYQMLQGVLLGSANNYIDRLSHELWGSDAAFARASEKWLRDHGISGITLRSPSGFDDRNVATPAALIKLAQLGMKNPVFAEIVSTPSAEIPGAGVVTNTNQMLEDAGVVGVKTGKLMDAWNLLTAKDVQVGPTTVRVFVSVLGQQSGDERVAVTRQLLDEVEKALREQPVVVPQGTVVGKVTTAWGERVDIVTDADTTVVLWNGASATASAELDLGEARAAGEKVGTLSVAGPIDAADSSVSLKDEVPAPSAWWRLTHPLELFGLSTR